MVDKSRWHRQHKRRYLVIEARSLEDTQQKQIIRRGRSWRREDEHTMAAAPLSRACSFSPFNPRQTW